MNEPLLRIFKNFERENICYCLLRDYDQLDHLADDSDVDLLVQENQFAQLHSLLVRLGFVYLPSRGQAPHHFFVTYDEDADRWLKLDVVTELAYGRPIFALRTGLATECLRHRRRREPTFVPAPEDELVTLLLHCVLDKENFTPNRRQRLQALRYEVTDEGYVSQLLAVYWSPTMTWPELADQIAAENWAALLAERTAVAALLASRDYFGTMGRTVRDRVLRTLDRCVAVLQARGLTVAFLAPDGAGKTTLAAGLQK